ncbi:hypothetical protein ALC56_05836, partial [Trachymyrmex septentrionalis]
IPVRRWIRGHYTKLTESDKATCNHCNDHFDVLYRRLFILHKHLVEAHPDKLTEEEKKEDKFFWIWDYFILKGDSIATCNLCNKSVSSKYTNNLKYHLKITHNDGITCNHCNDKYSIASPSHYLHKHLINEHPDKLTEEEQKEDKFFWIWDYFTLKSDLIATCNLCNKSIRSKHTNNLRNHIKITHKEEEDNLIPTRRWIREHYTKLRKNGVTCNHCNDKYIIEVRHLYILHKHLVEAHPDKLTEEEKKEDKFFWIWDYFTLKGDSIATCNLCNKSVSSKYTNNLKNHLKITHKIFGPSPDSVINNESNSYNHANLDINNLIPVRRWIRGHYTKLRNTEVTCNHCNGEYSTYNHLHILHKHLVKEHPDKLTEEEKKEDKFLWSWDYFTIKDDSYATCKICPTTISYTRTDYLTQHLKNVHK